MKDISITRSEAYGINLPGRCTEPYEAVKGLLKGIKEREKYIARLHIGNDVYSLPN